MPEDEDRSQRAFAQFEDEERIEMIQGGQDIITAFQFGNAIVFPGLIESADASTNVAFVDQSGGSLSPPESFNFDVRPPVTLSSPLCPPPPPPSGRFFSVYNLSIVLSSAD
jgi:hypothetical protein